MDNKQTTQERNVIYINAPNNADKFMFRLSACIKDIEFSRAIDEMLPPFVLKKKIALIRIVYDEVTKSNGAPSWRWVVIIQWLREMSLLIKDAWTREEKAGIEIGQTAVSVLKSITSELDSLYAIVEANIISDPEVQRFHDECVMDGCLDGTLMHGVARPPPLLDEGDDDEDDACVPVAKRQHQDQPEEEEADEETQEPPAFTPPCSPPQQSKCPDAPHHPKPVARVQEVTVVDDEETYTTFTINFHFPH